MHISSLVKSSLSLALAPALTIGLAACGGGSGGSSDSNNTASSASSSTSSSTSSTSSGTPDTGNTSSTSSGNTQDTVNTSSSTSSGATDPGTSSSSSGGATDSPEITSILSSTGSFAQGPESFARFFADAQNGAVTFNGEAAFTLNPPASSNAQDIQLMHPMEINANTQYTVCYDAKADAVRTLSVVIDADEDGQPNEANSAFRPYMTTPQSLTTEFVRYTSTFQGVDDATARLVFNLGLDDTNVTIDNVGVFRGEQCGLVKENITARVAASQMGMGINIGNTFDAHSQGRNVTVTETLWRPAMLNREDIQAIAAEGYGHVRIPATWNDHTLNEPPYTIDSARLDRYEEVVDWALAEGLYVMINMHHEEWIIDDYSNETVARFTAIWDQLATRFANKSSKLIFEILNEPGYFDNATQSTIQLTSAQVDGLNRDVLANIRETQPTRIVVYAGTAFSGIGDLQNAVTPDANDEYLFANFHSYDPFEFAIICTQDWVVERDRDTLEGIYQAAVAYSENNNNIPLMVNEFGAPYFQQGTPSNDCDDQQRLDYIQAHAELAKQYNVVPTTWSDGMTFSIYSRPDNTFDPASKLLLDAFGRK